MKKHLIAFLVVFMFLASFVLMVPVSASEYDLFNTGRVTFTVDVPKGFDRVVYVTLMDDEGATQQFPILPESKYRLVEDIVCGPFRVSGFVENDPWFEYTVLRDQDVITVSQDKDLKVHLTVTTETPEIIEEPVPAPEDSVEDVTEVEAVVPDETEDLPEETESAPSEEAEEDENHIGNTAKSLFLKLLSAVFYSAIFAGIVIVVVYFVRKHLH